MKYFFRVSIIAVLLILSFIPHALAVKEGKIKKSFKNIKEVKIKTVSGDCIIKKGNGNEVEVILTYSYYDEEYEPKFEQRGDRLILTERFRDRTSHGRSTWNLTVPEQTNIDFSTASGNLEVEDLQSTIEANTASGNVQLSSMIGEFEVSTASGDVEAKRLQGRVKFSTASGDVDLSGLAGNTKISTASGRIKAIEAEGEIVLSTASGDINVSSSSGEFEVSAASGDVEADNIVLKAESSFSAASGDVEVALGKRPEYDLKVSAASGDATLNFNNNPIKGFIKMTAKARRGRIRAPFKFDDEDYYYKWDDEYVTKTVTRGRATPVIEISTASGNAVLLEN